MVPTVMVPSRLSVAALLVSSLVWLGGCSNDDFNQSGNECVDQFGFIPPVERTLPSFRVGDGESVDAGLREVTVMRVFFQAIMPDPEDENSDRAEALAREAGQLSRPFIDFTGDFPDYQSTRNMPDLMEALIVSGQVDTFNNARNAMRRCFEEASFGRYKNSQIRLTVEPQEDSEAGQEGDEPPQWQLELEYSHNPSPNTGNPNIRRFIRLRDFGVTYLTLYDRKRFSATGFNPPQQLSLSFNQDVEEVVEESDGEDTAGAENGNPAQLSFFSFRPWKQQPDDLELWVWSRREGHHSLTGPDGEPQEIACMIFQADYRDRVVEVWTQKDPCSGVEDGESLMPLENFRYSMNPDVAEQR
ncbi:MAG: hypothetical protein R3296_05430 [Oleiphilaceae bacterium]|nr:hypothetical protein [Oleiphilaceae bacterium]